MGKVATEETLLRTNHLLSIIARNGLTDMTPAQFKQVLKEGEAKNFFEIGDQLVSSYMNGTTQVDNPWDLVHFDADGNAYLKMHYAYPDGLPFDAPEAIYAADAQLAAGTYHIEIGQTYGAGWIAGNGIQFTLAKPLPAGGQICIACGENNANDPAAGRTLTTYATAGDTTVLETTTTSAGKGGTKLGVVSPANAQKTSGQFNAISRVVYGNGRYSESAVRQWLNSEVPEVGKWWTAQNQWDRPPTQAATTAGFLSKLPADFVQMLDYTDVTIALNTVEGYPTTTETVRDRIFLPSLEEMYINPQLAGVEGEPWDYFKTLAAEAGLPGKFQQGQTYPILKTYNLTNKTSPVYVFLRSCGRSDAISAWVVYSSGYVASSVAYSAVRGCPACKISAS